MNSIKNRLLKGINSKFWNATTELKDFAIISYLVDIDKLRKLIPEQFEIISVFENGIEKGIMSAVPFFDKDFKLKKFFPFIKFKFYQTNYRVYVKDKSNGEHLAWFFGTNLGSVIVNIPRLLWRIPWHYASFKNESFENNYNLKIESKYNSGHIQFTKTNEPISVLNGFKSMDEMLLILTHPIKGVYYKLNGKIGTYRIAHKRMELFKGIPNDFYFSLYENLGLLTANEMKNPLAIFYMNSIQFDIELPPKNY